MGLRYRDLMVDVGFECMPGGPTPPGCVCTATAGAPQCTKGSQNPVQKPNPKCPKASSGPNPKKAGGLDLLRQQLRAEIRAQG